MQEAEHSVPVPRFPYHGLLSHLGSEAHQQAGDQRWWWNQWELLYRYQQVSGDISSPARLGSVFNGIIRVEHLAKINSGNCPLMFFN